MGSDIVEEMAKVEIKDDEVVEAELAKDVEVDGVKKREKKDKKREWLKQDRTETAVGEKRGRPERANTEGDVDEDDWDELAREERMAKKVKKGLVSQDAFDGEFGEL